MQVNDNQFIKINSEESVYLTHKKIYDISLYFVKALSLTFKKKREIHTVGV